MSIFRDTTNFVCKKTSRVVQVKLKMSYEYLEYVHSATFLKIR